MVRATEVEVGEDKAPVLAPGHSFGSITDKISGHRAQAPGSPGMGFWILRQLHGDAGTAAGRDLSVREGRRSLGRKYPRRVGIRHRQFCLVDRNRSRRNFDFGHSFIVAAIVAEFH